MTMEMAGRVAKITKAERRVVNEQMLVLLEWAANHPTVGRGARLSRLYPRKAKGNSMIGNRSFAAARLDFYRADGRAIA